MQSNYEPIKIPLSRKWKEARIRFLPFIVFGLVTLAVVFLWDFHISPTHFVGMAESDRSMVIAGRSGTVMALAAGRFDQIHEGDIIASIHPVDASVFKARLNVILAEVELIRSGLDPITDQQRNLLNYEGLRLDLMNARIDLATTRINRDRLRREMLRAENLYEKQLLSESEFDLIVTDFELADMEVLEKQNLISDMEERLQAIDSNLIARRPSGASDPIAAAIDIKERELNVLEAEMTPYDVRAPISGMISQLYKHNGDYAGEGEPLMTISADGTRFILGYIRQPLSRLPELGTMVEVRSRSRRVAYEGYITHIGNQMEPMHEAMLRPGQTIELALPVRILIDPDSDFVPGEMVDISLAR